MEILLLVLGVAIGVVVGLVLGLLLGQRSGRDAGLVGALSARGEDQAVIRDGLDRLDERMRDLEHQRVSWQSQLRQQVDDVRHTTDSLRRETGALATALRRPHVRGQWGELHLRRCVEAAGMVAHCDFEEQVHLVGSERSLRPDLVVRLAGGRSVVVDAKTPLEAYLDALSAPDDEQVVPLQRHARQVRNHVDALSSKAYWSALPSTPEFVVMFVPSESCLSAALGADPTLIEYAATHKVVLASPTTLIALLRTVAHGWTTETVLQSTREIHELGRELHDRLSTMGGHFARLGKALSGAVDAYNGTVGSLESRVLVTARQFEDIGVTDAPLSPVPPVDRAARPLTAIELCEHRR
ncbi:DNA recombination protein RmuC [Nocardioides terrisoli]|uniref:DNA recombination protein RmuC n=1 Tax=Nocardioides terrisoli TaxID=3388267 RepID=UPI00287B618F|nr:DNA recombination protein RmuC [Nocardioides marmorisolisilvae]